MSCYSECHHPYGKRVCRDGCPVTRPHEHYAAECGFTWTFFTDDFTVDCYDLSQPARLLYPTYTRWWRLTWWFTRPPWRWF
jgi:hypothetical protein